MGVSAQHDGITLGEGLTEMKTCLGVRLGCSTVEEPTAAGDIWRKDRTMSHDKGVAGSFGIVQDTVYLWVIRIIEIYNQKGVVAYVIAKGGLGDLFAQLL